MSSHRWACSERWHSLGALSVSQQRRPHAVFTPACGQVSKGQLRCTEVTTVSAHQPCVTVPGFICAVRSLFIHISNWLLCERAKGEQET